MSIPILIGLCVGLGTNNIWLGIAGFLVGAFLNTFEDILLEIKRRLPK